MDPVSFIVALILALVLWKTFGLFHALIAGVVVLIAYRVLMGKKED